jgi:hypothetical protein
MLTDGGDFDDIGIVPFPRDPRSDTHFQRGRHNSMMLVAGANNQNINGFKAYKQCLVITAQDSVAQNHIRHRAMLDWNWTENHLDILDRILQMPVVFDFKNGIGEDVSGATWDSPVEKLTKPVFLDGESFAELREENRKIIEARIDMVNSRGIVN